jgi:Tfp pilus assembly pilus retraction ATPase PilT
VTIVSQRLVTPSDGKGRVPAVEVLVSTGRVYDRIIDPEATIEIRDIIGEGAFSGMQTFDQALVGLVESGLVPRRTPGSPPRAHTTSSSRSAGRCFEADQASSPAARRAARSIGCLR